MLTMLLTAARFIFGANEHVFAIVLTEKSKNKTFKGFSVTRIDPVSACTEGEFNSLNNGPISIP